MLCVHVQSVWHNNTSNDQQNRTIARNTINETTRQSYNLMSLISTFYTIRQRQGLCLSVNRKLEKSRINSKMSNANVKGCDAYAMLHTHVIFIDIYTFCIEIFSHSQSLVTNWTERVCNCECHLFEFDCLICCFRFYQTVSLRIHSITSQTSLLGARVSIQDWCVQSASIPLRIFQLI